VDKRIDVIATAIRLGGGVSQLKELELAYAPPYSSAKDPVNMAGFVAENIMKGIVRFSEWNAVENNPDAVLLDVREEAEIMAFALPGAKHIPLGQLRDRINELDKNKRTIVFCAIGVRSYNATRILMQNGFTDVLLYPAGTRFYRSTHYDKYDNVKRNALPVSDSGDIKKYISSTASISIDCTGLQCPGPIMKVFETLQDMKDGEILEVTASDPGFMKDIGAWCRRTGNTLLTNEKKGNTYVATVKKGSNSDKTVVTKEADGKTIIVFSGDLDKVLASFIIANGAAAMGRPVTMFFTFWGLTALRKAKKTTGEENIHGSYVRSDAPSRKQKNFPFPK